MVLKCLFGCIGRSSRNTSVLTGTNADEKRRHKTTAEPQSKEAFVESQRLSDSSDSVASSLPSRRKAPITALCVVAKHTYGIAADIPYPSIDTSDEVLIRTHAVGLNPIDWKSVDYNFCMPSFPWIGGRELAGTVEEVGSNVKELKVGDRVWASTYYRDRRAGTFQEFCVVPQHTVLPLPPRLSFDAGACLGVAALTAAMTLWKWLHVTVPISFSEAHTTAASAGPRHILIWGGSTVTGQFAIQLARHSGLSVIAVTSEKTATLAARLGAEHVITRDHRTNDEIAAAVRAIAEDDLTLAIDIVGNTTGACCLTALSTTRPGVLAPLAFLKDAEVIPQNVSIAPVEMKRFIIEDGNRLYAEALNRLVGSGVVTVPEVEVLHGGLQRVEEGLQTLKRGDLSGRKLVVRIA
ncbi:hypothetical protein LTR09_011651 [Extremus antarcticus]|uniref:Enoyl reductase (ER) domain-containing protein n=1 Tax=Extremus antarcticus TaxID=702011 RepID=A0AAJ0D640_9PEZI|nr:hypothetical protein LTR09_011651 [Extremus antarcticus]